MKDLGKLVDQYLEEFKEAEMYGGWSRTLKKKLPSKQQVRMAFIEDIQEIGKVKPELKDKVDAILKGFE
tara:strand:+ start:2435 stop:2641 length:207 start_codon:yes stop_codon:yes gene_type:complete